jgi:hypothetical protein
VPLSRRSEIPLQQGWFATRQFGKRQNEFDK